MLRRTSALAAALSLLPLGQPLLVGTVGITTATTAVVLQGAPAIAQDASAVARIAKAITVRIEGATQGSGVIVKKEGNRYTVLTAWHVVSGNRQGEELAIFTPDGKEHQLEQGSIQRLGQVDMAVLTFSSSGAYEVAPIGDVKSVSSGNPIFVSGFPLPTSAVPISIWRFLKGDVIANATVAIPDGYQLLYSNPTLPGMSGGSVLNAQVKLVGIHGRSEKDDQVSMSTGKAVSTGTNQAVPISYYKQFDTGQTVVASATQATSADDYLAQALSITKSRAVYGPGKNKHLREIIRLINAALARKTKSAAASSDAYSIRASANWKLGDIKGAIEDSSQAIKFNPANRHAYLVRGNIKVSSDDDQGAIDDFTKAIALDPQHPSAYNNRGVVKRLLGDTQGAIADFNKAIKINPQHTNAYTNRGVAKSNLKDYQAAIADYNKSIEIDPQYAIAYKNRAYAKRKLGDHQEAIADYNKLIEIDPQSTYAYNNRGIAKINLKDYKGAITDYNKAIDINPQYATAYAYRGIAKSNLKDYKGAIADYNKAIQIDPQFASAYAQRGSAKDALKDYQGAIADYNKAIAINPQLATAYAYRGFTKGVGFNDLEGACPDFKKAASLGHEYRIKWLNSEGGAWCRNMR